MKGRKSFAEYAISGFTLVELLIVIVIISVVAAILFPVFAKVKTAALQTTCLSNLKQVSMGVLLYSNDQDDGLPWSFSWDDHSIWAVMVEPYVRTYTTESAGLWRCPVADTIGQAYATNCQVIGMIDTQNPVPLPTTFSTVTTWSRLDSLSDTVFMGDAITSEFVTSDRLQLAPRSPDDFAFPHPADVTDHSADANWPTDWISLPFNDKQISYRHNGGANLLFADFHAHLRKPGFLKDTNWDVRCVYGEVCEGASGSPPYSAPNGSCGNQSPINCQ